MTKYIESNVVGCEPPACQPYVIQDPPDVSTRVSLYEESQGFGSLCNKFDYVWGSSLYGDVQCVMGNGHMGPLVNRQRNTHN